MHQALSESKIQPAPASNLVGELRLVSVVLATLNERENILNTIEAIFVNIRPPVEIIVVDDDSSDETWRILQQIGDPRITVIRRIATRGLASAVMRGIIESRGAYVAWMDADNCMPAKTLADMLAALDKYDIAIGSRYATGGEDRRARLRIVASRLINGLGQIVLRNGVKDVSSGFVIVRRQVFDKVLPMATGYGEYFIEFIYVAYRKGLSIIEVPYIFTERTKGASKSFSSLWSFALLGSRYVYRILRARMRTHRLT